MKKLIVFMRNLVYRNRINIRPGNEVRIPVCSELNFKKVKIKLRGKNNSLVIGKNVTITNCEIRLYGSNNKIEIGDNVRVSSGKIYLIITSGQAIRIGVDTTVEGAYMLVDEAASISIGRDCMISTEVIMRTGDKHSILDVETNDRINNARDINISDRVWIGRDVTLLKGAVLKPETIVATRSLVSREFDEGSCVVAGVPAKVVKRGVRWDRQIL